MSRSLSNLGRVPKQRSHSSPSTPLLAGRCHVHNFDGCAGAAALRALRGAQHWQRAAAQQQRQRVVGKDPSRCRRRSPGSQSHPRPLPVSSCRAVYSFRLLSPLITHAPSLPYSACGRQLCVACDAAIHSPPVRAGGGGIGGARSPCLSGAPEPRLPATPGSSTGTPAMRPLSMGNRGGSGSPAPAATAGGAVAAPLQSLDGLRLPAAAVPALPSPPWTDTAVQPPPAATVALCAAHLREPAPLSVALRDVLGSTGPDAAEASASQPGTPKSLRRGRGRSSSLSLVEQADRALPSAALWRSQLLPLQPQQPQQQQQQQQHGTPSRAAPPQPSSPRHGDADSGVSQPAAPVSAPLRPPSPLPPPALAAAVLAAGGSLSAMAAAVAASINAHALPPSSARSRRRRHSQHHDAGAAAGGGGGGGGGGGSINGDVWPSQSLADAAAAAAGAADLNATYALSQPLPSPAAASHPVSAATATTRSYRQSFTGHLSGRRMSAAASSTASPLPDAPDSGPLRTRTRSRTSRASRTESGSSAGGAGRVRSPVAPAAADTAFLHGGGHDLTVDVALVEEEEGAAAAWAAALDDDDGEDDEAGAGLGSAAAIFGSAASAGAAAAAAAAADGHDGSSSSSRVGHSGGGDVHRAATSLAARAADAILANPHLSRYISFADSLDAARSPGR